MDLILKGQMLGHRQNGETTESMKQKAKDTARSLQEYCLFRKQVCHRTFSFAQCHNKPRHVGPHLVLYGLTIRIYGNKGKNPRNALTISEMNNVILFINSYENKTR